MVTFPSRLLSAAVIVSALTVVSASAATSTSKKPPAVEARRHAVLAVYQANKKLQFDYLTNRGSTALVPTRGPKIYTGAAYRDFVADEARVLASGIYYEMARCVRVH